MIILMFCYKNYIINIGLNKYLIHSTQSDKFMKVLRFHKVDFKINISIYCKIINRSILLSECFIFDKNM